MNKLNNKTIIYNLSLLAILIFGAMLAPTETKAQATGGNVSYGNPYDNNQNYYNYNPNYYPTYYQVPVYVQTPAPAPTPTVYSSTTNPNAPATAPKAVAKAKTTDTKTVEVAKTDDSTSKYGDLAANVLFGSESPLPTGLMGWTLFAILILAVVLLARKLYGGSEKYHATPLKHN